MWKKTVRFRNTSLPTLSHPVHNPATHDERMLAGFGEVPEEIGVIGFFRGREKIEYYLYSPSKRYL